MRKHLMLPYAESHHSSKRNCAPVEVTTDLEISNSIRFRMCSPKMGRGGYDVTYSAAGDLIDGNERKKADEEGRKKIDASKAMVYRPSEITTGLRSCVNGEKAVQGGSEAGVVGREK
ncbi:hypothetical protein GRF29_154g412564 [Pseudopithomyces chartarum]|uniref:Uncharacterized protein n=1 Tax=Pseudopithomyces chartarum TaxID=1892770 RepID=A0AAN6LTY6_9PLEO|nr:hypothetical protein GRF29_154g412564 [Pseudopithomyces chartarum]